MDQIDLLKLLGQSGLMITLIAVLGRVIWIVGQRMVKAIDDVTASLKDHTRVDLEHHTEVRDTVTRFDAKLDGIIDAQDRWAERTPAEGPPKPKRSRTHPGTQYYVKREDDDK